MTDYNINRRKLLRLTAGSALFGSVGANTVSAAEDSGVSITATAPDGTTVSEGEEFEIDITVTNETNSSNLLIISYNFLSPCDNGCDIFVDPAPPPFPSIEKSGNWNRDSVLPGESVSVSITLKAEDQGFFRYDGPGNYSVSFTTQLGECPGECDAPEEEYPDRAYDSVEITVEEGKEGFDPTVHGFGFTNWSNFDLLTLEQIKNRTTELQSRLSSKGLDMVTFPGFTTALALGLSQAMEGWANGHCLGMTTTARDYYNGDIPDLPDYDPGFGDVETAIDIEDNPEETSSLSPVEQDIDIAQSDQFFDSDYALRYIAANNAGNNDNVSVDEDAVLRAIHEHLSNGEYPSVGLTDTFLSGHSVMAYDIVGEIDEDDTIYVAIYDPNEVGISHYEPGEDSPSALENGTYPALPFSMDESTGKYQFDSYTSGSTYNKTLYIEPEIDTDYDFFLSEETGDAYNAALEQGLGNYIAVGITGGGGTAETAGLSSQANSSSSVDVSVTTSDGEELESVDVPTDELQDVFGYEEAYFQFGTEADGYEVEVSADESTSYTVEVKGSKKDGGVIDDTVTNTVTGGETDTLTATVPDKTGQEGSISSDSGNDDPSPSDNPFVADDGTPASRNEVVGDIGSWLTNNEIDGTTYTRDEVVSFIGEWLAA